jgi:hypothetical protein
VFLFYLALVGGGQRARLPERWQASEKGYKGEERNRKHGDEQGARERHVVYYNVCIITWAWCLVVGASSGEGRGSRTPQPAAATTCEHASLARRVHFTHKHCRRATKEVS